jgi:hypothetical protein
MAKLIKEKATKVAAPPVPKIENAEKAITDSKNDGVKLAKTTHETPLGLKAFKDAQREGKASQEAPDALVVEDMSAQVKQVTVKCNESGSFRIGPDFYCLSKGKNAVLPESVANEFRKNNLVR